MQLLYFCPQWGHEHLSLHEFIFRVKQSGYDGVEMPIPSSAEQRKLLMNLLEEHDLKIIAHQHAASGNDINSFCKSYVDELSVALESDPMLINSHTGLDSLSIEYQIRLLDVAEEFAIKNNCRVLHETHRGRIGYSPQNFSDIVSQRSSIKLTADFSHWVCITESYLENFPITLNQAIQRSHHIHARIGFPQGPQVPDPRWLEYTDAVTHFMGWWDRIVAWRMKENSSFLTITPEFGPPPYMWVISGKPVADQWELNVYMMNILRERYEHISSESMVSDNF